MSSTVIAALAAAFVVQQPISQHTYTYPERRVKPMQYQRRRLQDIQHELDHMKRQLDDIRRQLEQLKREQRR